MNEKEESARKRLKPNHVVQSRNDDVREVDMETSDGEGESRIHLHWCDIKLLFANR